MGAFSPPGGAPGELLVAEGYLLRKTSTWEPHVAVNPERLAEVRAIIRGEVRNPRLARFVEGEVARAVTWTHS